MTGSACATFTGCRKPASSHARSCRSLVFCQCLQTLTRQDFKPIVAGGGQRHKGAAVPCDVVPQLLSIKPTRCSCVRGFLVSVLLYSSICPPPRGNKTTIGYRQLHQFSWLALTPLCVPFSSVYRFLPRCTTGCGLKDTNGARRLSGCVRLVFLSMGASCCFPKQEERSRML